jgi:TonB family protein
MFVFQNDSKMNTNFPKVCMFLTIIIYSHCSYSQVYQYKYTGRNSPTIKKELLYTAHEIKEVMPEFSSHFTLPFNDHQIVDQLKLIYNSQGYSAIPSANYIEMLNIVSADISVICNGKTCSSQSSDYLLTADQRNILSSADLGTDIRVKIKFYYRNLSNNLNGNIIKEGEYVVTVIPSIEAAFPGGFNQFEQYLNENVAKKIPAVCIAEKMRQAIVNFTVDENGRITDPQLSRSSSDPKIDRLLLDAIRNMPDWIPAKNYMGINVKEKFRIPLGNDGC